jgi:hypothetical protein
MDSNNIHYEIIYCIDNIFIVSYDSINLMVLLDINIEVHHRLHSKYCQWFSDWFLVVGGPYSYRLN